MITTLNNLGLLHSYNDQPSLIDYMGNKFWYINGKLERDGNLPCVEYINGNKRYVLDNGCYKITGKARKMLYESFLNSQNKLHRLNAPAYIDYYDNGNIRSESYYHNGRLHRLNGPAYIYYNQNENIQHIEYYIDGKLNRLNGPAQLLYNKDFCLELTRYFVDGKLDRIDGPAIINHIKNFEKYYVKGKELSQEQFLRLSKNFKSNIIL